MRRVSMVALIAAVSCLPSTGCSSVGEDGGTATDASAASAPGTFEVDPFWPKPLPHNWILGQVAGIAVDAQDHVWIAQRPGSVTADEAGASQDPPISTSGVPAPPIIEFDQDGAVIQAWGGPETHASWPKVEHGLFIDHLDRVWVAGLDEHIVLAFDRQGRHLLTIGEPGVTGGSSDTAHLGRPAEIAVDPEDNEVYIADGYGNRRIIVFDSRTGEYKRHWGAYGETPRDGELGAYDPDAPPIRSFRNPVHAVSLSNDGLVYVADRVGNRIQVFQKDGTFLREAFVAPRTLFNGAVWDIELSPDPAQTWLYVPDGTNMKVWILRRDDLSVVGSFGRGGRNAGQFNWVHNVAADSQGNLYTTEVNTGKRVQRFVRKR